MCTCRMLYVHEYELTDQLILVATQSAVHNALDALEEIMAFEIKN